MTDPGALLFPNPLSSRFPYTVAAATPRWRARDLSAVSYPQTTMNTTHFLLASWRARHALVANLAVCLSLAAPVTRAADEDPRSSMVQFADLNLAHPEGVKKLYNRYLRVAREKERITELAR